MKKTLIILATLFTTSAFAEPNFYRMKSVTCGDINSDYIHRACILELINKSESFAIVIDSIDGINLNLVMRDDLIILDKKKLIPLSRGEREAIKTLTTRTSHIFMINAKDLTVNPLEN